MEMEEKLEKLTETLQEAYTEEVVDEVLQQLAESVYASVEFGHDGSVRRASIEDVLKGIGVFVIDVDGSYLILHSTADGIFYELV